VFSLLMTRLLSLALHEVFIPQFGFSVLRIRALSKVGS
jgi:hypothetical protein